MKSQTERPTRRPNNQRSTRSTKVKRYTKQTARGVEAKRDGKPLIFGWGKHLSHSEKIKVQRRATWAFTGLVVLVLVGVILGTWINTNIIIPGLPITTVNGHQIPQSEYRKMVALKTLLENNKIFGRGGLTDQRSNLEQQDAAQKKIITDSTNTVDSLNKKIKALPAGPSQMRTDLNNQLKTAQKQLADAQNKDQSLGTQITTLTQTTIPLEQQIFTVSQISTDSATWLQDDELIREWEANESTNVQSRIEPSSSAVNKALNALKASAPANSSYNSLLSQMSVSDDDMRAMMTIKMRRDNMQNYLSTLVVSPTYQVLARSMTIDTQDNANKILKQLKSGSDFGKLAAKNSQDANTKVSGGNLGWLVRGQYAQSEGTGVVDNWLFDPARKLNEISPVLKENGAFHIVQILGFDPARTVDAKTLQSLKDNALSSWLLEIKAQSNTSITPPDQNKQLDPNNLPPSSILPSSPPGQGANGGTGLPTIP